MIKTPSPPEVAIEAILATGPHPGEEPADKPEGDG